MSVTFTAEYQPSDTAGFVIACCDGSVEHAPVFADYVTAKAAYEDGELTLLASDADRPLLPGCEMPDICPDYGWMIREVHTMQIPDVQASNANARTLLNALGYGTDDSDRDPFACTEELSGSEDADSFLGRVLLALAVLPEDAGLPVVTTGRVHDCGRAPGYVQEKLNGLRTLAQWCQEHGRAVSWA